MRTAASVSVQSKSAICERRLMLVQVPNTSTLFGLMQQDPLHIRDKLLTGVDREYNVSIFVSLAWPVCLKIAKNGAVAKFLKEPSMPYRSPRVSLKPPLVYILHCRSNLGPMAYLKMAGLASN